MNPSITTPAADAAKSIQALIADEAQYLCVVVAKATLATLLTERSALIAERDALQLDLRRLMEKHNALHVNAQAVRVERDALRASFPQWISITDARKPAFRRPVLVRVEWSKGWGYARNGAWRSRHVLERVIPASFDAGGGRDGWRATVDALTRLDPHGIFRSPLLDRLLG